MNTGAKKSQEARYWNTNSRGICIMASISEGIDWAAYIGADDGWSEEALMQWTLELGAKLSREDAEHFFPDIDLPYRR